MGGNVLNQHRVEGSEVGLAQIGGTRFQLQRLCKRFRTSARQIALCPVEFVSCVEYICVHSNADSVAGLIRPPRDLGGPHRASKRISLCQSSRDAQVSVVGRESGTALCIVQIFASLIFQCERFTKLAAGHQAIGQRQRFWIPT